MSGICSSPAGRSKRTTLPPPQRFSPPTRVDIVPRGTVVSYYPEGDEYSTRDLHSRPELTSPEKSMMHHCHLRTSVLILALTTASLLGLPAWEARAQPEPAKVGEQVPGFEIEALRDSRRAITHSDFDGRYVLLNLWATWCAPCIEKIPDLQQARQRYSSEKLAILNISLDRSRSKAAAFLEKREMPGSHAYVSGGLPNVTLVGPEGKVADTAAGDSADLLKMLSEHLSGRRSK